MTYKYEPKGLQFQVDTDGTLRDNLLVYHSFREAASFKYDVMGTCNLTAVGAPVGSTADSMFNGHCATFTPGSGNYTRNTTIAGTGMFPSGARDFSMCAWIKPNVEATSLLVASQYNATGNQRAWAFGLSIGRPWAHKADSDGTYGGDAIRTATITKDVWILMYAYWDMDTEVGISVNNEAFDTTAHTENMKDTTTNIELGAYTNGNLIFGGLIGQWVVWDKILTAQELTDMYNAGAGNMLVGYDKPN